MLSNKKAAEAAKTTADAARLTAEKAVSQGVVADPAGTISQLVDLLKALQGTIEAITKAGPALAGLVASVAFLAISTWFTQGIPAGKSSCSILKDNAVLIEGNKAASPIAVNCDVTKTPDKK